MRNLRVAPACIGLALTLLQRDFPKYGPIVFALFAGRWGLERWRVRLIRATYFYFRYLDDIADGDGVCPDGPGSFLDRQSSRWCTGPVAAKGKDEAAILFGFIWTELCDRNLSTPRVRSLALQIIEGLRFDLARRSRRQIVRRAELDRYYTQVILAPADLAHLIVNAQASPGALHEISLLIGRLQSLRDFDADWSVGLLNIPLEDLEQVSSTQDVCSWRIREIGRCAAPLRALWEEWHSHADARSCAIMRPAVSTLLTWVETTSPGRRAVVTGRNVLVRC